MEWWKRAESGRRRQLLATAILCLVVVAAHLVVTRPASVGAADPTWGHVEALVQPIGLASTDDGRLFGVSNELDQYYPDSLTEIDPRTGQVLAEIPLGAAPTYVLASLDGSRLFVATRDSRIIVLRTSDLAVVATHTASDGFYALELYPVSSSPDLVVGYMRTSLTATTERLNLYGPAGEQSLDPPEAGSALYEPTTDTYGFEAGRGLDRYRLTGTTLTFVDAVGGVRATAAVGGGHYVTAGGAIYDAVSGVGTYNLELELRGVLFPITGHDVLATATHSWIVGYRPGLAEIGPLWGINLLSGEIEHRFDLDQLTGTSHAFAETPYGIAVATDGARESSGKDIVLHLLGDGVVEPPAPPTVFTRRVGDQVQVHWDHDQGDPVTGFVVGLGSKGSPTDVLVGSDQRSFTFDAVERSQAVSVRVQAAIGPTRSKVSLDDQPAVSPTAQRGYYMLGDDGRIEHFGSLADLSLRQRHPAKAVDLVVEPGGVGAYVLYEDGYVEPRGGATDLRSILGSAQMGPGERATAISTSPTTIGYWIFTDRGRVIPVGGVQSFGDLAHIVLQGPIIDAVAAADGRGYYMLGSDGGVFAFGSADFFGSIPGVLGANPPNCPIVGLVPTPSSLGYWLVACDGGVFAFGDAPYRGSLPALGVAPAHAINAMVAYQNGYLMTAGDGGAFVFGDAQFYGSVPENGDIVTDIVTIAPA